MTWLPSRKPNLTTPSFSRFSYNQGPLKFINLSKSFLNFYISGLYVDSFQFSLLSKYQTHIYLLAYDFNVLDKNQIHYILAHSFTLLGSHILKSRSPQCTDGPYFESSLSLTYHIQLLSLQFILSYPLHLNLLCHRSLLSLSVST